jgi:hypothetical protein
MAYTKYTGKDIRAVFSTVTLTGLQSISIDEDAASLPEKSDTTVAGASAYEMTEDPLGSKGTPKLSVILEGLASEKDFADSGIFKLAMNLTAAMTLTVDTTGTGKDKLTHAAIRLVTRARTIKYNNWTNYAVTLEVMGAGTWGTTA